MIICKSCGFNINGNMKFAIKSNKCPCCGGNLFENEELKMIKKISSELLSNGFKFKEEVMRNLSIFIINKISKLKTTLHQEELTESFAEEDFDSEDVSAEHKFFEEQNLEENKDFSEETMDSDYDEENRVERLRRLAKENTILNKRGAAVRRIGD